MVGASGFGREALDVLEAMRDAGTPIEIVGVVDDVPSPVNLERLGARGIAYLGTIDVWLATPSQQDRFVLGIGSPQIRRTLVERIEATGRTAFTAVHPNASIGSAATLGDGVVVCAGAVISTNVSLGRHVHVNPNATIGHDSRLEDFVSVNPASVISGEVHIATETLIGAGAVVLQQRSVGSKVVVGASALVAKNVPANVTVKGVPGKW